MEEQLKEIIAQFIKSDPSDIKDSSEIRPGGSILMHRMFAAISRCVDLNLNANEYMYINTFGELRKFINKKKAGVDTLSPNSSSNERISITQKKKPFAIGIDIEETSNFPIVEDFREDKFYLSNFSQKEISYCILQHDPYQAFAGKFAAKEAIFKTGELKNSKNFSEVEILNDRNGSPFFEDFYITISHNKSHAVAIAVRINSSNNIKPNSEESEEVVKLNKTIETLTNETATLKTTLKVIKVILLIFIIIVILDAVNIV